MAKVAILGCGRWGQNHLRTLAILRDEGIVESISVIDTSEDARSQAELADYISKDMDGIDADLVIIATPSHLHSEQARELISTGHHVLVEKPLGCCESEAAQVLSCAQEYGKIAGVGLLLRFHPAVKMVKHMISNGELGRLESLRFVRRTTRPYPAGGNVIESLGVHAIDLMCHFMSESEPSAVNVEGDKVEARIALEFPHGIEAIIDVGWETSAERRIVTIVGSIASVRFDLAIHDRAILIVDDEETELKCPSGQAPLESELRHIIHSISNLEQGKSWHTIPDYGAALRGVRWTERAIQALPITRPH